MATSGKWIQHLQLLQLSGEHIAIEVTEGLLLDAHESVVSHLRDCEETAFGLPLMTSVPAIPHWLTLKNLKSTTLKSTESLPETCTRFEYLALCKAIIIMAHKLGIKVIAEGVENQSQHDLLLAAGCNYAPRLSVFSRRCQPPSSKSCSKSALKGKYLSIERSRYLNPCCDG